MQNKTLFGVLFLIVIAGISAYALSPRSQDASPQGAYPTSPKDATYLIDGQSVSLTNGTFATSSAPGSASMTTTQYFGNEATGDLNGDDIPDTAFILTQSGGGSGTFYYVVAALQKDDGYHGTSAVLLGDRIAPQSTTIVNGVLTVNYADRKADESFDVAPSVGKSLNLKLDTETMQFGEIAQNFEGEADPSRMTLGMQAWNWIKTTYNNDTSILPHTEKFTLTFNADNTFSATTDCNNIGGNYAVDGTKITFSKMVSTLMFCEGSQEQDFTKQLSEVQDYLFTSKGELVLGLKLDSGSMFFR